MEQWGNIKIQEIHSLYLFQAIKFDSLIHLTISYYCSNSLPV